MTGMNEDIVSYRLNRAKNTLDDAHILAEKNKWNSTINRLYYAAYYAVTALLLKSDLRANTHNGVKSSFSEHFIKTNLISKELGRIYSQLFTWRQKGDYDDLFDFERDKVLPYFEPVKQLIEAIEKIVKE
jgi:uncharacterized protein (UPF0332 family)